MNCEKMILDHNGVAKAWTEVIQKWMFFYVFMTLTTFGISGFRMTQLDRYRSFFFCFFNGITLAKAIDLHYVYVLAKETQWYFAEGGFRSNHGRILVTTSFLMVILSSCVGLAEAVIGEITLTGRVHA